MMRVKDVALVLIFACVAQQFLQVDSLKDKPRRGRAHPGKGERRKGQKNETGPQASSDTVVRGRFSTMEKAQCTWVAASEGDRFLLGVTCAHEGKDFECKYVAKPTTCQRYSSNSEAYWKQIGRSLKKLKGLCRDFAARVKAVMCRRAPKEAHFRLVHTRSSSGVPSPPPGSPPCPGRVDKMKRAEEYCTSSWSSLCTFLFSMVENDECA
ncbi:Fibroblast growth factor-binding protein 1 [Triplophysa tibetana]|uniref:Fibroblast growth factor-binding protein 1 n=1 Tax=Triplophysa tibetana TaxID=1572043 RepID=A0A5A9NL41_9TELE|nr:Fibroblast growth factor-binding protein 1 [Triplophysa tibetana]